MDIILVMRFILDQNHPNDYVKNVCSLHSMKFKISLINWLYFLPSNNKELTINYYNTIFFINLRIIFCQFFQIYSSNEC